MFSLRRHSDRPASALVLGVASALLLGTAAHAQDQRFVLSAYTNVAGGPALLQGDYATAIRQISAGSHASALDTAAVSTNRCVLLTLTRHWAQAHAACDEAVENAQRERLDLSSWELWSRQTHDNDLALAYSNRAVLKWLSNDAASAAQDLARAQDLAPQAGFVARNLAALGEHSTLAQATAAPQS